MKKNNYNQELMDQYIELHFSDSSCQPITEEERELIADTLEFNSYCLSVAWDEFIDETAKVFHLYEIGEWFNERPLRLNIFAIVSIAFFIGISIFRR